MHDSKLSQRLLARMLRARLRNSVPQHILDNLSDEQLIDRYHRHCQVKAQLLAERAATANKNHSAGKTTVELVR